MDQRAFLRKGISGHYTETTETTEIKLTNLFRVYLSPNRKYLIISSLTKDFIYIRVIFNIKTGKFTYFCRDILQLDNKYTGRLLLNSAALLQIEIQIEIRLCRSPGYGVNGAESYGKESKNHVKCGVGGAKETTTKSGPPKDCGTMTSTEKT